MGLGTALWFTPPPAGVTSQAWHLLSIFLATIAGIITTPLPLGAVAMLGLGASMMTNTLSFAAAFSAFANEARGGGRGGVRRGVPGRAKQPCLFAAPGLATQPWPFAAPGLAKQPRLCAAGQTAQLPPLRLLNCRRQLGNERGGPAAAPHVPPRQQRDAVCRPTHAPYHALLLLPSLGPGRRSPG